MFEVIVSFDDLKKEISYLVNTEEQAKRKVDELYDFYKGKPDLIVEYKRIKLKDV